MKVLFCGVFNTSSTNYAQLDGFNRVVGEKNCAAFPYRDFASIHGQAEMNSIFVERANTGGFNAVVLSKCHEILDSSLKLLRPKVKKVLWYMDPIEGGIHPQLIAKTEICDEIFCGIWDSYVALKEIGGDKVHFLHEGYDHLQNYPVDYCLKDVDVSFIGDLRGHRYSYYQVRPFGIFSNAYGEMHSEAVSRSKINLNFTHGGCSDRVYKVLASKGFLLTQPWPEMERDFKIGHDLDVFSNPQEYVEKINFYLKNEDVRERIAANGHETVQKFSRIEWARKIIEQIQR